MINLTDGRDANVIGESVKVIAVFDIFEWYESWLDSLVGRSFVIKKVDRCCFVLDTSRHRGGLNEAYLPRYSVYFSGDTMPVEPDDIIVAGTYVCEIGKLNNLCNWEVSRLMTTRHSSFVSVYPSDAVTVTVDDVIRVNPGAGDVLVSCTYEDNRKMIVPYTTLFRAKPAYNRRKLIYEFSQWNQEVNSTQILGRNKQSYTVAEYNTKNQTEQHKQ